MKNIILFCILNIISGCSTDNKPVILFFGDSLTSGPGLKEYERFSSVVQKKIDQEEIPWRVENAGVSGNTLDDGLKRIHEALDLYQPKIVFVCLGANDYLRGGYKDISVLEKKLETLVNLIKDRGHQLVLAGVGFPLKAKLGENFVYTGSLLSTWLKGTDDFLKLVPKVATKNKLIFVESILDPIPPKSLTGSIKAATFQAAKDIQAGDFFYALARGVFDGLTKNLYEGLKTSYNNIADLAAKININNIGLREFYEEGYFLDEVHPNAKGHLLMGERIFTILKPLLN